MGVRARHVSLNDAQVVSHPLGAPSRSLFGTLALIAVFLPVWLPKPLLVGEFSLAFALPFVVALWALLQPAPPGTMSRALAGVHERGLWLEALCAAVIFLMACVSMFVSEDPSRAFRVILPMTYGLCALIVVSRSPPSLRYQFLYALLFAGVLALGAGLVMTQTSARAMVMPAYRFWGFFENANQLGVMVMAVWPLAIALLISARFAKTRLLCGAALLILASTVFLSGTKTALALGFVSGAIMWLYHASRTGSLGKALFKILIVIGVILVAIPASLWVLSWANPIFMQRIDAILADGVWNLPSMVDRSGLWAESFRTGMENPLLGEGAGTIVLGRSHSHNMFADYFRGMGMFALIASVVLFLSVISRGTNFIISTWGKGAIDRPSDTIVLGMYLGAIFYLIGNQLSDSFSPTTSFLFWMMYLGAFMVRMPTPVRVMTAPRASTLSWVARPRHRSTPPVAQPA